MSKYVTIYRRDFLETAEANFFEDILQSLGIPEKQWENIEDIELKVEKYVTDNEEKYL